MAKRQIQSRQTLFTSIRQVLQYFLIVFVLNYATVKIQSVSDAMINADFINPQTNQRQIFYSMNAIHLIQKAFVLGLCALLIKAAKSFLPSRLQNGDTHRNETYRESTVNLTKRQHRQLKFQQSPETLSQTSNNNQKRFSLTIYEQIFLGVMTFISMKLFVASQSKLNIIYIVVSKYSNFLFITIAISFALLYYNSKKGDKLCTKDNWKKVLKNLFPGVILGSGIILAKLIMTEIPSFFRSYAGKSPQQSISSLDIIVSSLALGMGYVLYIGLFLIKQKHMKSINTSKSLSQQYTLIQNQLRTLTLLSSWTKYTFLLLFVQTLVTGELSYLIQFINSHPSIMGYLIQICFFYFVSQWVACRALLKYQSHVYFCTLMTNGIFLKAQYYIFKSFNLLSVPYYLILIGFYYVAKQIIKDKTMNRQVIEFQTNKQKQIKDYDSVDMEEKNLDYHQQNIDLQNIPTEPQQYQEQA